MGKHSWNTENLRDCSLSRTLLIMKAAQLNALSVADEFNTSVGAWPSHDFGNYIESTMSQFLEDVNWLLSIGQRFNNFEIYKCLMLAHITLIDDTANERIGRKCNVLKLRDIERKLYLKYPSKRESGVNSELGAYHSKWHGELGIFCRDFVIHTKEEEWLANCKQFSPFLQNFINHLLLDGYNGVFDSAPLHIEAPPSISFEDLYDTYCIFAAEHGTVCDREGMREAIEEAVLSEKQDAEPILTKEQKTEIMTMKVTKPVALTIQGAWLGLLSSSMLEREYSMFHTIIEGNSQSAYSYEKYLLIELLEHKEYMSRTIFEKFIDYAVHAETMANYKRKSDEVDYLGDKLKRSDRALQKLQQKYNNLQTQSSEREQQVARNKKDAVARATEGYEAKIAELEQRLREAQSKEVIAERTKKALDESQAALKKVTAESVRQKQTITDLCDALYDAGEDAIIEVGQEYTYDLKTALMGRRCVICGFTEAWRKRMVEALEKQGIEAIGPAMYKEPTIIGKNDIVLFNRHKYSHHAYYSLASTCSGKGVRILMLENDNVDIALQSVHMKLTKKKRDACVSVS